MEDVYDNDKSTYQMIKVNLIALIIFMRKDQKHLVYRYIIGFIINYNLFSKYNYIMIDSIDTNNFLKTIIQPNIKFLAITDSYNNFNIKTFRNKYYFYD